MPTLRKDQIISIFLDEKNLFSFQVFFQKPPRLYVVGILKYPTMENYHGVDG